MKPIGKRKATTLRRVGFTGMAAAALFLSIPSSQATLLGVELSLDRLVYIDTSTGAATLGPLTGNTLQSVAANSVGEVFGFNNTFFRRFGSIDPVTGGFSIIATYGAGTAVLGMAFNSADILYGVENSADVLETIDTVTGARTTIGATGFNFVTGIAFDGSDILYGYDGATDQLITIDTTTGAGTAIGVVGLSGGIQGLAFEGGILYGADTGGDQLVTIDTSTGAATVVGPMTGTFNVTGLTNFVSVSIPETGAPALIALGLAGLMAARRRAAS